MVFSNLVFDPQHMEIMIWCVRHEFLEDVKPRHTNITVWRSLVCKRKSAAIERSWPEAVNNSEESSGQDGSLFIEDALGNLETEQGNAVMVEELKLASAQKDGPSSVIRSKIEGIRGCYPFENVRAAVDILFLCGSSDLVVAMQATVSYFSFYVLYFSEIQYISDSLSNTPTPQWISQFP